MDRTKSTFVIANLAVISLLALLLASLLTIQLASPSEGLRTADRKPLLSWKGMQGEFVVSIDDDPGFASPATARVAGNSYAPSSELGFGTYYWKVESGAISSGVGTFTVASSVIVTRNESGVSNAGNAEILLSGPSFTGAFVLAVNESAEIGENENVMAEQA